MKSGNGPETNGKKKSKQGPRDGSRSARDIATITRRKLVQRLRMNFPPMPVREIAKQLDIGVNTVMTDLRAIRAVHSHAEVAKENREMTGRALEQLDILAGEILGLISKYKGGAEKASLYAKAHLYIESRNKLMVDIGIIKKVPEEITVKGNSKVIHSGKVDHDVSGEVKAAVDLTDLDEKLAMFYTARADLHAATAHTPPAAEPDPTPEESSLAGEGQNDG